jgi:hypothetical protein
LLFVASSATAANDDYSFGGAVRYFDAALSPTATHRIGAASSVQTFVDSDRVRIEIPLASVNSTLYFSLTPYVSYYPVNSTVETITATLVLQTSVSIDSAILNNPLLIDHATCQPFGGSLTLERLTVHYVNETLPPSSSDQRRAQYSQECISGLISVRTLQTMYGLSSSNARLLLRSPMTVRFSTTITALNHLYVSTKLGVQLFGD